MHQHIILQLAGVVGVGVLVTWFAWRFRLPSILLLLLAGFIAGPVTGLLDPDALLGPLTFPVVSLSAAIILFEGGLSASWREIRSVAGPVRRLVTVGLVLTWMALAAAASSLLGLPRELGLLLGAILVVTGPTVIGPLLLHVRPRGRVGSVAKLEGIINDPIGAIVAVLVYEVINVARPGTAATVAIAVVLTSIVAGVLAGFLGAALVVVLLRKRLLPAFLQNAVTVAVVLGVYVTANAIQEESGLLAVTLMGMALATQRSVDVRAIVQFNEHVRVMLIPVLFIVLAARIDLDAFRALPLGLPAFVLAVFGVRIVAVLVSLLGTDAPWRERVWLCGMAPRGIVAAAVSSLFGIRLSQLGWEGADLFMPVVFIVIVATVVVYGLGALPLAKVLGLHGGSAEGVLVLGAGPVARTLARGLERAGVRVLLVDPDWGNVATARQEGLEAEHGLIASQRLLDRLDLEGIGHLLAVSHDDQANTLAVAHFRSVFEQNVYQLQPERASTGGSAKWSPPKAIRGRPVGGGLSHRDVARLIAEGAVCKVTRITDEFDYTALKRHYGRDVHPLFVVGPAGHLEPFDEREKERLAGSRVVSLVEHERELREPLVRPPEAPAPAVWQERPAS